MATLDHPWTCPNIDRNIEEAKGAIYDFLDEMLTEVCPMFGGDDKINYLIYNTDILHEQIQGCMEEVRESNAEIRESAENQLAHMEEELEDAKWTIECLEKEIAEKNNGKS
jgi:hypothetical protein